MDEVDEVPMGYPWSIHGVSMEYPWSIHGVSMEYPGRQ
jgi:uncharacterized protein (UPF0276 family)